MKKMPTQLLEYLVHECTKEVLDQLIQEKKLKVKHDAGNEKAEEIPIKHKISVNTKADKNTKFYVQPKKVNEEEEIPQGQNSGALTTTSKPEVPSPSVKPKPQETPTPQKKSVSQGSVIINPSDKSREEPISFNGKDDGSIERVLYNIASKIAGSKVKISLGAMRLGREVASNPLVKVYFYFGKLDPSSEEVFLMADKSEQIAKEDSIQPSELQGTSVASVNSMNVYDMTPDEYEANLAKRKRGGLVPRYGIDEATQNLIKKAINHILDRR